MAEKIQSVTAMPQTTEGLYIDGMVFPSYPKGNEDILLTANQYQYLVGKAQMSAADGLFYMDSIIYVIVFAVFILFLWLAQRPNKQSMKVLEHLSAKGAVESVHGDVKVVIEKQNQILQMLQNKH